MGGCFTSGRVDGKPKLDVDLAPELGQPIDPRLPLAVSPRKELLVLDAPQSRVLRYQHQLLIFS